MQRTVLSTFVLIAVLITSNQLTFSQANTSTLSPADIKRIEKVKRDLADIGVGKTITVSRLDNRDFFGKVKTIGTIDFEIVETDSKRVQMFNYLDIKNVRSGDGVIAVTGQRKNNRGRNISFIAVLGGLLVLVLVTAKSIQ